MLKRFSEISMRDVTTCWWKWASLWEMMNAWLPIPNWFVLTTNAYWKDSTERAKNVLQAFDKLDTKFVAVRSSWTKEDWVDDSFAWQFDTYLFVTRENLIERIKECHDSVNSERIISYCDYKWIDRKSIKVAVVIQKMVNSDSAGVCFTVNPVSQNHDEIMIDAWFWVWEAVVSWMITPDNYIVNKKTWEIKKNISQQEKKLILSDKWWTLEVEVIKDEQGKQKLSDENIKKLSELAVKIEDHYWKPMDTERAVENWELYMLQARPITTLWIKNEKEDSIVDNFLQDLKQEDIFAFRWKMSLIEIWVSRTDKFLIVQKWEESIQLISYWEIIEKVNKEFEDYWNNKNSISNIKNKIEKVFKDIDSFREKFLTNDLSKITDEEIQKLAQNAYNLYTSLVYSTAQYDIFGRDTMLYCMNKWFFSIDEKTFIHASKSREISFEHRWNRVLIKYLSEWIDNVSNIEYIFTNYWNTKSEKEIKDYLKTISIEKLKNVEDEYDKELSKNNSEIDDWYNKQSDEVKKVADFGMVISWLKDMRKDYIWKMWSIIYHLDKEMCRRANIDKRGWAFISPKELCLWIIWLKNIKSDIEKRINNGVVCFWWYNLDWIIEPCNYDSIINEIERKIPWLSHDDTNIIHWQIWSVWKGIVRWFVKVVLSPDNADFKKWDILVTSMTRPEFLPLMKNAKAVITNEWWITCHAAIVSRELWIPSIIGTKNATQILKDWDLVEVDADNWVVRILNSLEKDNLKLEILWKTYTPEYWQNPEVFFNYQWVPFYTSVFAKCYSLPESNRSTPAYYVSEFKEGGTIIQYCAWNFVEKWYNIINDLLEWKTEWSEFLAENDKRIVDCFKKCKKYINSDKTNFLDIWRQIEIAFANGWHIFNFSHALQDYLNKLKESDINLYQILSNNIVAPEKTFINKAWDYLKELVDKYPNDFNIVYENFMKEYGRFQNSYLWVNKNITKKWLKNYYESLLESKNNESEEVSVTNIPEKYKSLVDVAWKAIIYQDNKKKLWLIAYEIMDKRLLSVSMKTGIPFEDFLRLTVDEILSYNLDSEDSINELKKKLLKYKNSGVRRWIMIDNWYIDIDKEFWDKVVEINSIKSELKEIKWIVWNKWKIVGRAKIVLSIKKDWNKLKSWDILVTWMIRPEFLPLMQKAGAFVTDEWWITCHAAIVSRELWKPCIIWTKIATQVLKDWDLVEVDADNWVVRILDSVSTWWETKNIQTKPCDKENLVDEFISSLTHKENLLPPITTSSIFVQGSIELYAKHMPNYVNDNASMNWLTIYRGGETYTYVDSTKIINIANTVVQLFFSKKLTQEDIFRRFNQYTDQIDRSYKLYTHNYLKNLSNEKLFDLAKWLINSFMEFDATSLFAIVIDEKFLQNHSSIIKWLNNLPKDFYKNASNIPVISFDKQQKKDVIDCLENWWFNKENLEKLQYLWTSYSRYLSVEKMKKFILDNYQTDNLSMERDMIDKEDENLEKAKVTYNKWYNSLTYQQQLIASFIYTSINLRDKRKNFTLKALCTISRIMEVFFVKNWLNKKYLWNIWFWEILEWPEYIISLKKRLWLREKWSVFFSDYNNQKLLIQEWTECFEVAFKKMKSLYNTDISNKIIQGFSGSSWKVQGTVKIVQFLDKNNNFKKWDVLVTGMTRPEFVPLMKKASAIVTDEWWITCHAAIVSRELWIPCVIWTKIATQVLKDWDLVEVDADNWIVRIL